MGCVPLGSLIAFVTRRLGKFDYDNGENDLF